MSNHFFLRITFYTVIKIECVYFFLSSPFSKLTRVFAWIHAHYHLFHKLKRVYHVCHVHHKLFCYIISLKVHSNFMSNHLFSRISIRIPIKNSFSTNMSFLLFFNQLNVLFIGPISIRVPSFSLSPLRNLNPPFCHFKTTDLAP